MNRSAKAILHAIGVCLLASPLAAQTQETPALQPPQRTIASPPGVEMEPRVARAQPANDQEIVARLQIFLDQNGFGPGKIDGGWGEFTWKALWLYQTAHGLPAHYSNVIPANLALPLDDIQIYDTHALTTYDFKYVGGVGSGPEAQAKQKTLPYSSALEYLSERYHVDPEFLRKLNPNLNVDQLKAGDVVRIPKVAPFKIEEQTEVKFKPRPEYQNRLLRVDTKERMLTLTEGDTILAAFPITPGSTTLPAPAGTWKVVGIVKMPWFRWDNSMLKKGVRSENYHNLPPGPNNPVGVVWMGLNKSGIGIHGTNSPMTIGRSASHGCIRVANWDVVRLADMVSEGCVVKIDQPDAPLVPKKEI